MPRFLTSQFTDELDNPEITIATLLSLEFESSEIFLWSGIGNVTYDGDLYLGNGWLQGHSPVSENGEAVPQGVSIVLTGIPQSLLSLVLSQTSQRKIGTLMLGALDDNFALIPDPTILYKGQIDHPEIIEDSQEPTIKIALENAFLDMDRPRSLRYTDASQRELYPEDQGMVHVEPIQKFDGRWGQKKNRKKNRNKRPRKKRG